MTRTFIGRGMALFCLIICPLAFLSAQQPMHEISSTVDLGQLPKCQVNSHAVYPKPDIDTLNDKGACYVEMYRDAAVSSPSLTVHADTRVFVRIWNPRPNETLQPTVVFSRNATPDIGTDILKNASNPLQSITFAPSIHGLLAIDKCNISLAAFDPSACETQIADSLKRAQEAIDSANAAVTCLESYHILQKSKTEKIDDTGADTAVGTYTCSPTSLINPKPLPKDGNDFSSQQQLVTTIINEALRLDTLDMTSVLNLMDSYIAAHSAKDTAACKATFLECSVNVGKERESCKATPTVCLSQAAQNLDECSKTDSKCETGAAKLYAFLQAQQSISKSSAGAVQTAQAALRQTSIALAKIQDAPDKKQYYFDVPSLTTANATIAVTEVLSKTNSTIATWTTTAVWQRFVLSTGLGFSRTVNRTFANTGQFQGGQPVLDGNGNAVSVVTETDNHFSVAAPEVMGSILIPWLTKLEAKCSLGCSFLLSGGIGANLNTKSAEFDTGISLRFMNFLLTPSVHWGREAQLIDGFTVGSPSGANAPSSLPTVNKWARRKGLVLTYVIPLT